MAVTVYKRAHDGRTYLSEHFRVEDFACPDGSAEVPIDGDLVELLENLYDYMDCCAMKVCAGYRSGSYARRIGREKDPFHREGKAVDILCFDRWGEVYPAVKVMGALDDLGHKGGAAYASPTCVHVDVGDRYARYDETSGGWKAVEDTEY